MEINRLAYNEKQLKRIKVLEKNQKNLLATISSALAIDSLYVFNTAKSEHPLSDDYCSIADELREKANVSKGEYAFLCGKLGLMELDDIIDFVIKKVQ